MLKKLTAVMIALMLCGAFAEVSQAARKKTEKAAVKDAKPAAAAAGETMASTDSVMGWDTAVDQNAKLSMAVVPGKTGKALQATYTLDPGGWVAFSKRMTVDFTQTKAIRFTFKGEGSINSIELKLENPDQGQFGVLLAQKTNEKGWTTVEVPLSEFKYWWGGTDKQLQLGKPLRLHFAISKKDGDEGMNGKFLVCQLEMVK
jgi:hypothetical protein